MILLKVRNSAICSKVVHDSIRVRQTAGFRKSEKRFSIGDSIYIGHRKRNIAVVFPVAKGKEIEELTTSPLTRQEEETSMEKCT